MAQRNLTQSRYCHWHEQTISASCSCNSPISSEAQRASEMQSSLAKDLALSDWVFCFRYKTCFCVSEQIANFNTCLMRRARQKKWIPLCVSSNHVAFTISSLYKAATTAALCQKLLCSQFFWSSNSWNLGASYKHLMFWTLEHIIRKSLKLLFGISIQFDNGQRHAHAAYKSPWLYWYDPIIPNSLAINTQNQLRTRFYV